jgi:transcriptional regulator GlxA family with amidase domain
MTGNLRQSITLGEMAQSVNLTPEHLCRVFKSHTGTSPARYFKRLKMQRAKELLETTCLRVKEIVAAVGMTDQSHFVRDFEWEFGVTPAKYRMLYRAAGSD